MYMKATGIVRRIDDLGRVVIPKEIRRTMRIREGDPLEIYTDHDGEVIFKKYSPIGELHSFASSYAETLNKSCGLKVVICDRDTVIACAGVPKKEYVESKISAEADELIEMRSEYAWTEGESEKFITSRSNEKISVLCPITMSGDIIGAVASITDDKTPADHMEKKMIQTAASFLSRQLEE
ncbi:MAG: AbrB/MazE/SpoVT family DNA-binding domain-containing protein [Clostridia bacterium]|nr:AbrB/MazE/SpoVT family DNA-binding domain-containing protein [Clostridia bacterium]